MQYTKRELQGFIIRSFTFMITSIFMIEPIYAQTQGTAIQISNFDNLLWSLVKTLQLYTVPIGALVIAGLGAKMMISGDDNNAKDMAKSGMIKVAIGMAIVVGAATIAQLLKSAVI